MDQASFPWRPLGALLAEEGLLTDEELEHALAEQALTRRPLGEILVDNGYLSGWTLTRMLAKQHGVDLHTTRELESSPSRRQAGWRPLGRLLVETRTLTETDLADALAEQERSGRRLGEVLIARGMLSAQALARALALQQGVELEDPGSSATFEAAIRPTAVGEPVYEVRDVPREEHRRGSVLFTTSNFLEAADFAFEHVEAQEPYALEIERVEGDRRESVWSYSEDRANAAAAERRELVDTYGFDPIRWNPRRGD
jgi:hypothetical protein